MNASAERVPADVFVAFLVARIHHAGLFIAEPGTLIYRVTNVVAPIDRDRPLLAAGELLLASWFSADPVTAADAAGAYTRKRHMRTVGVIGDDGIPHITNRWLLRALLNEAAWWNTRWSTSTEKRGRQAGK